MVLEMRRLSKIREGASPKAHGTGGSSGARIKRCFQAGRWCPLPLTPGDLCVQSLRQEELALDQPVTVSLSN